MITEKLFRDNVQYREKLRELLDGEVLKTALEIVAERAKPRQVPEARAHAHLDTVTSQHYHKLMGIQSAIDRLRLLAEPNPPESPEEDDGSEFFHSLPELMKEAIRQARAQNQ